MSSDGDGAGAGAGASPKNVNLKTSDGATFEVEIEVIKQSQTIKHMIEDDCANEFIPIPNVEGKVLSKVIEYCKKHYKSASENIDKKTKEEIRDWDIEFMNNLEKKSLASLMEIVLAANYLEIKDLIDLTAQKIADHIKDKPLVYIRKAFNLNNDFEDGEVERLKKQYGCSDDQ